MRLRSMNAAIMAVQFVSGIVAWLASGKPVMGLMVAFFAPFFCAVLASMLVDADKWVGPAMTATFAVGTILLPIMAAEAGSFGLTVLVGIIYLAAWLGFSYFSASQVADRSGGTAREHFPEAIPWLCIIAWVAAWSRRRKSPALLAL